MLAVQEASPVTFVCCVESGPLENMTARLVRSLRANGGRFATCKVIAVTPRVGPQLSRSTRHEFGKLGVSHVSINGARSFDWYHYLNKPRALVAAEKVADTDVLVFLDSDILVLSEPSALQLTSDEDFVACAPDTGVVGTLGPSSPHDYAWRTICELVGIAIDDLPWIVTCVEQERIRLYWNAGVFGYRRSTGFASRYLAACIESLRAGVGFPTNGEHNLEQVLLSIVATDLRLRWRMLPHSHNFATGSFLPATHKPYAFKGVQLLHYHDAMRQPFWDTFMGVLSSSHPDVAQMFFEDGPIRNPAAFSSNILAELLRIRRGVTRRRYRRRLQRMELAQSA